MDYEKIRRAIIAIIEGKIPLVSTWAKVKSVSGQTCTITIDELDIENILLGFNNSGVIVYPVVNSDVLVLFIDKSKTNGAVVHVKETDKVEIMGNSKGGLAIVSNLTQQYNKVEQDLNTLKQLFTAWVVVASDGGAALKAVVATWASNPLTQTIDSDIENDKVKHGQG
jgi:hypothetical protein